MRVRALKYYYHDKQEHHPGEEFEMDDRQEGEINILCTIGTLEKVSSGVVQTRAMKAEEPAPEPALNIEPQADVMTTESDALTNPERKKYYRRRDMRADK